MKHSFKDIGTYKEGDIIIAEQEIIRRLDEIILQIAKRYKNKRLLLVGLLTGAAWLTVDILKRLHTSGVTDAELTFMKVSSYKNGTTATYEPKIEYDMLINPKDRTILLVDDIADTGKTFAAVTTLLRSKDAAEVRTFVLLDKPSRRKVSFIPDYICFTIPDIWVQGRGMDSDGFGRGDPNIRKGPYYYK